MSTIALDFHFFFVQATWNSSYSFFFNCILSLKFFLINLKMQKSYETKQYKKGLKAADAILKKFPSHGGQFPFIPTPKPFYCFFFFFAFMLLSHCYINLGAYIS